MNLLLGIDLLGKYILAGPRAKAAVYVVDYEQIDNHFTITFYDKNNIKMRVLTPDMQDCPVSSVEFEIVETGCGDMTLVLEKDTGFDLGLFYNQRVDIALFGDEQPWYSGYLQSLPKQGGTKTTDTYKAFGFFDRLDLVLVNESYQNKEIAEIVRHIMLNYVDGKVDVVYNGSQIYNVGYTAEGLKFEYRTAKECFKTLAEFATNYVYGVDAYRQFFFKPINFEINEKTRFWVGQHVQKFEPEEDINDVINFFYTKYGYQDSKGSNVYGEPFYDAESMGLYGRREALLSIPEAVTENDVMRWAGAELDKIKKPKQTGKAENFDPEIAKRKVTPDGMARIITADGRYTYDYPIKSTRYKIDGSKGLQFTMTLGDYEPRLDRYIAGIYRDMKNSEYLQQLNNAK